MYLEALVVAIAAAISVLMASAWVVQQRTGNSGWVDTIWTFSLGLVGVRIAFAVATRSNACCAGSSSQRRACSVTPVAANGA
jgi:steroid 5-alpha reductase family enzyme